MLLSQVLNKYLMTRLMAWAWDLRGQWEKRSTWYTANWMAVLVLYEMYSSIPTTAGYDHSSSKGSPSLSVPNGTGAAGVCLILASSIPVYLITLLINPGWLSSMVLPLHLKLIPRKPKMVPSNLSHLGSNVKSYLRLLSLPTYYSIKALSGDIQIWSSQ